MKKGSKGQSQKGSSNQQDESWFQRTTRNLIGTLFAAPILPFVFFGSIVIGLIKGRLKI